MKWSRLITAGVLALAVCGDPSGPQPEDDEEEEDPSPGVAAVVDLEARSLLG